MQYLKIATAAAVGLVAAGCATPNNVSLSDLRSAGEGVVLYYFPRPEACTSSLTLDVGPRDPTTGLWEVSQAMRGQSLVAQPLPAGEYAVLQIRCIRGVQEYVTMRAATAPITITGLLSGIKFIKPMVTFRVAAGEVVNIGAISAVVLPDRKFTPVIGPIPPNILAAFQAARPDLAAKMITRPMMRPYAQPAASEGAAKRR